MDGSKYSGPDPDPEEAEQTEKANVQSVNQVELVEVLKSTCDSAEVVQSEPSKSSDAKTKPNETVEVAKTELGESVDVKTELSDSVDVKTEMSESVDVKTELSESADVKTELSESADVEIEPKGFIQEPKSEPSVEITKDIDNDYHNISQLADDLLTPDESFMAISEEEQEAWNTMMKEKKKEMSRRQDEFQEWMDKMTKRRMFALSKMKNIEKLSRERTLYYDEMRKHLHRVASSNAMTSRD